MGLVKQVLVYRRDLKMRKGKIGAQVAHAAMKVFFDRKVNNVVGYVVRREDGSELIVHHDRLLVVPCTEDMWAWVHDLFTKIVLAVDSEGDLLEALRLAKEAGLPTTLVTDAGKTEFHGVPKNTCIAIGPGPVEDIDCITGKEGAIPVRIP